MLMQERCGMCPCVLRVEVWNTWPKICLLFCFETNTYAHLRFTREILSRSGNLPGQVGRLNGPFNSFSFNLQLTEVVYINNICFRVFQIHAQ